MESTRRDPTCTTAEGCVNMCGMCPCCVFAPQRAARRLWRLSDDFPRSFMVDLIRRCRNTQVLQRVRSALDATSWSAYTYARARSPTGPEDYRVRRGARGKPAGLDVKQIWDWFDSSRDWTQSQYLLRIFSFCDPGLLRMLANLAGVLVVRQKRGFMQFNVSSRSALRRSGDEDSVDPVLMVVPGSSRSMSGVSRYRDFIGCLPAGLSKRILGLLDEVSLARCLAVCRFWQHLGKETMQEVTYRKQFQHQIREITKSCSAAQISPTYAGLVDVPVPAREDEEADPPRPSAGGDPAVTPPLWFRQIQSAYADVRTRRVQMEERNVYCGAFFTAELLNRPDSHRVLDCTGGPLLALASKDSTVQLLLVAPEPKVVSVLRGHMAGVQAVLLREDRDLLVTGSCDMSIRCWDLKTDTCAAVLYGHTGTVNCLDVHADRLVSGAKDCLVKVWSLRTRKHCEDFNLRHPGAVQCVKVSATTIYSSCDRGLVKAWDLESASLLRVIDSHRSAVKCLFFDEWHLLSGEASGQVMAWSARCDANRCLATFSHPDEVKSLALVFLRVVTACVDGKIRIFSFLTGDCLRRVTAEAEAGQILSVHFHDCSLLVNSKSSVKRLQFAKVFWDYAEGAASEAKLPFASAAKLPFASAQETQTKPERTRRAHFLSAKSRAPARASGAEPAVLLSEKAASERIRRRGLHHPPTLDAVLLRAGGVQRARSAGQLGANMEHNARLRDSWGPEAPPPRRQEGQTTRPKTCGPVLTTRVQRHGAAIEPRRPGPDPERSLTSGLLTVTQLRDRGRDQRRTV